MGRIVVARNRAAEDSILDHLKRCDRDFATPLSSRVSLPAYSAKLAVQAERAEAWFHKSLIGLVAFYEPDDSGVCFISNVSVDARFRRWGLGERLLGNCAEIATLQGALALQLEVDPDDMKAQRLYTKFGFSPLGEQKRQWGKSLG